MVVTDSFHCNSAGNAITIGMGTYSIQTPGFNLLFVTGTAKKFLWRPWKYKLLILHVLSLLLIIATVYETIYRIIKYRKFFSLYVVMLHRVNEPYDWNITIKMLYHSSIYILVFLLPYIHRRGSLSLLWVQSYFSTYVNTWWCSPNMWGSMVIWRKMRSFA